MVHVQLGKFSSQATTSSLWALSVLQASRDPVFISLVDRMANMPLDVLEPLQLQQLFQVTAQKLRGAEFEGPRRPLLAVGSGHCVLQTRAWAACRCTGA